MAGSGTFLDIDFVAAPTTGWARKTGPTTYSGTGKAGFPLFLRADGYLDGGIHPPLGIPGGRFQPAPHFLNPPNNNFEDALTGWTTSKTGTGTAGQVDATAANKRTGLNSIKLTTAAAADTSVLTGPVFPAGYGIPLTIAVMAKSSGSKGRLTASVTFFTNSQATISTITTAQVTGLPTTYAEYGGTVVPPAGTSYAQVTVTLDTAADTVWIDEVRAARDPIVPMANGAFRSLQSKAVDRLDIRDYLGVDLTGANDMTTLMQTAVNDAIRLGERLYIPDGTLVLSAPINAIGGACRIEGKRARPSKNLSLTSQVPVSGTWLHLAHTGQGFLFDRSADGSNTGQDHIYGSEVLGGIGTYRDQPATPTTAGYKTWQDNNSNFDWAIHNHECVLDVFTLNSSRHIELLKADKSRVRARGEPLQVGVQALYNYDCITIDDIFYWWFWNGTDAVKYFRGKTHKALITGRADGIYINRLFAFNSYAAWQILNSAAVTSGVNNGDPGGTTFSAHAGSIYGDYSEYALLIDSASQGAQASIDLLVSQPPDSSSSTSSDAVFYGDQSCGIFAGGVGAQIAISKMRSDFIGANAVYVPGNYNRILIGHSYADRWNQANVSGATEPCYFAPSTGSRIDVGVHVTGPYGPTNKQPVFGANSYPGTAGTGSPLEAPTADMSSQPISLAAGATIALPGGAGRVDVMDSNGNAAIVFLGQGNAYVLNTLGTLFTNGSSPSSSQVSFFYSAQGGTYVVKSGGSAYTLYMNFTRLKSTA